jgi:transcriptional regulator of acetoin/glycerol metabolism
MLMSFKWPGNVRQLEQATRAAVAICEGDSILPEDFPSWLQDAMRTDVEESEEKAEIRHSSELLKSYETGEFINDGRLEYIKALEETKYPGTGRWNLTAAARQLNIPRKTFTYRLKRMRMIG